MTAGNVPPPMSATNAGGTAVTVGLPFLDCQLNGNGTALAATGEKLPAAFGHVEAGHRQLLEVLRRRLDRIAVDRAAAVRRGRRSQRQRGEHRQSGAHRASAHPLSS